MSRFIDETGEYADDKECVICHCDLSNTGGSLCFDCMDDLEEQANEIIDDSD